MKRFKVKRVGMYFEVIDNKKKRKMHWEDFYDFIRPLNILSIRKKGDVYEVEVW